MGSQPRWALLLMLLLLVLHQNYWMWADTSLIAGIPVNLAYHLLLCLLTPVLMYFVVRRATGSAP